jgi:hypothetical protein
MTNAARHSRRARDAQTALRSKFLGDTASAGIALNIAKLPELVGPPQNRSSAATAAKVNRAKHQPDIS